MNTRSPDNDHRTHYSSPNNHRWILFTHHLQLRSPKAGPSHPVAPRNCSHQQGNHLWAMEREKLRNLGQGRQISTNWAYNSLAEDKPSRNAGQELGSNGGGDTGAETCFRQYSQTCGLLFLQRRPWLETQQSFNSRPVSCHDLPQSLPSAALPPSSPLLSPTRKHCFIYTIAFYSQQTCTIHHFKSQ